MLQMLQNLNLEVVPKEAVSFHLFGVMQNGFQNRFDFNLNSMSKLKQNQKDQPACNFVSHHSHTQSFKISHTYFRGYLISGLIGLSLW